MKKNIVILLVMFVTASSFAEDGTLEEDLSQAALIASAESRLEAYDSILTQYGLKEEVEVLDTVTGKWMVSCDVDPGDDLALIRRILEENRVVFQCTPYNEGPITAVFDTTGLAEVAAPYQDVLGW